MYPALQPDQGVQSSDRLTEAVLLVSWVIGHPNMKATVLRATHPCEA